MMQDFDRTLELVDISSQSYGATLAQQEKYMGGLQAATALLTESWQELITSITSSDFIIGVIDILTGVVNTVKFILDDMHMMVPLLTVMAAIGLTILNNKIQE